MDPKAISSLPIELQSHILSYLPLSALLTFARTSKFNNQLSTSNLNVLHLAVFPKRFHSILACLNEEDGFLTEGSLRHQVALGSSSESEMKTERHELTTKPTLVSIPTNPRTHARHQASSGADPKTLRHASIHHQNTLLDTLLCTPSLARLHALTIHATALLSPELSSTLASFPFLQHLTLNFSHPYIHDPAMVLPAHYWSTTPMISDEGSPVWNGLAGIGDKNALDLQTRGLRTLNVTRAAVTSKQMTEWVRWNERLTELRLEMVSGVDQDFAEGVAEMAGRGRLRLRGLRLERCANLVLREERDFDWVESLVDAGLVELGLTGCTGVDETVLKTVSEERRWIERGLKTLAVSGEQGDMDSGDGRSELGNGVLRYSAGQHLEVDPKYA